MILKHVRCLAPKTCDACATLIKKYENENIVVFLLPYKLLNHYNCTNCQNVTKAKDGLGNSPMSNFLETTIENQK
jgi:hypothetical protein